MPGSSPAMGVVGLRWILRRGRLYRDRRRRCYGHIRAAHVRLRRLKDFIEQIRPIEKRAPTARLSNERFEHFTVSTLFWLLFLAP